MGEPDVTPSVPRIAVPTRTAPSRLAGFGQPLQRTALTWWGGSFAAFLFSPLAECSHCVQSYLMMLPVQPGVLLATLCGANGLGFAATAGAITLALLLVTAVLLRELGVRWWVAGVPLALLAAAQGVAFGHALRM